MIKFRMRTAYCRIIFYLRRELIANGKEIKHLIDIVARGIVSIAYFSITFEIKKWLKINSIYLSKKKK